MICKNCNKVINDDLKFCPYCGEKQATQSISKVEKTKKSSKSVKVAIITAASFLLVAFIGVATVLFTNHTDKNGSGNMSDSNSLSSTSESEDKLNHQLEALDTLTANQYDKFSFTNGGKYLSNVYELGIFGEGVTDI